MGKKYGYTTELFSLLTNKLPSLSWEAGSRARSSVKCRDSSPCSSWPEDSCSTLVFPFFPSRSFKIIYQNTEQKCQKQGHKKKMCRFKDLHFFHQFVCRLNNIFLSSLLNDKLQLKSLTFLRAVGRFTLGISLSFPLLIRGAVESRALCGAENGC